MSDPSLPDRPIDTCPRCWAPLVAGMVVCPDCEIPLADPSSTATGPLDPRGQLPATLDSGQSLGDRYTIVERVGAGGMGLIYKALDRRLGRHVALKMIQAGVAERPGARERFKREILLAQQVSHPNVCRVHDLGEFQGQPFISMEYVEGQTLETLVQSMGHLSPSQTVSLAKQICAGLAAIHQRGIVHRDLKPANVMVDRMGHVVLMDFGMAYHEDQERLTQAGAVFGTLGYLSPEQMRGRVEPRSDLYALGLILYEMLTGKRPPGDGDALPLALREKGEACPPPGHFSPEVPEALDQLVMRCLEREPEKRFESAAALGEVLRQFEGQLTRSGMLLRPEPAPSRSRRRALLLAAGGIAVTGLLASAFAVWRRPPAPAGPQTLALLPLAYSGPPENDYLKDLLPLVLSQELAGTPRLTVTPFSVSRSFAAHEDLRGVARQLGVSLVVAGRAASTDAGTTTLRLRAVTADGQEVWADERPGTPAALLEGTPRLAIAIARAAGVATEPGTEKRPPEALRHYLEGLRLLEGWDTPQNDRRAIASFEAALAAAPNFAAAEAGRARALLEAFNVQQDAALIGQAAEAAERAVSISPELPEGHLALGLVQLWRGRSLEGSTELEAALRLAPADDAICRRIAEGYSRTGRTADARRLFQRALDLRPNFWENHNAYGSYLLQAGDLAGAEREFRRVIELRPESHAGYGNLGATLLTAGRAPEAEPFLLAALKIRSSAAVHNNLGVVYYARGLYGGAAEQWQAAIRLEPNLAEHHSNLGDACRQLGRNKEALAAYRRAIALWRERLAVDASDLESRAALAMALAATGQCDPSAKELVRAGAPATDRPAVAYYSAIAAALCGREDEAERLTLRALRGGAVADVRTNPDLRPITRRPSVQLQLAALDRAGQNP